MSDASNNSTNETASTPELTASEYHTLLSVDRRRLVLDILEGTASTVDLEELAAEVAAREHGSNAVDEATRQRIVISLHHNHLPCIDDAGLIDYDPHAHIVDPTRITDYQFDGPFAIAPNWQ